MNTNQAVGFMLLACKNLNLDKETVKKLRNAMYQQFDLKTEVEAEELGHKYFDEQIDNGETFQSKRKLLEKEFEEVWNLYPRRLGKKKSYEAYIRARKRGASYEQILVGLQAYLNYIQLKKLDEDYIKHGSTWFNNQGWEDDYM